MSLGGVPEDADVSGAMQLAETDGRQDPTSSGRRRASASASGWPSQHPGGRYGPNWNRRRSADLAPAVITMRSAARQQGARCAGRAPHQVVSFGVLARRVRGSLPDLAAHGVRSGDRVAVLVPPGADLIASVYACWRIGAVVVCVRHRVDMRGVSDLAAESCLSRRNPPRVGHSSHPPLAGRPILAGPETARIRSGRAPARRIHITVRPA